MGDTAPADAVLLFPPQTEARLFPYLSLPCLTGHLRAQGRTVHQEDLNLGLFHELLQYGPLMGAYERHRGRSGMRHWYRAAMAETACAHLPELRSHVLTKHGAGALGPARAVRLANQAVETVLEDSFLTRPWPGLDALDAEVARLAAQDAAALDPPTATLRRLLERTLAATRPRLVGLSVAFFSQLAPALLIAAWVRALQPEAQVWLGGQQVMLRSGELLGLRSVRHGADALCTAAGEEPLAAGLDALDGTTAASDVPGVLWTAPGRETGAALPLRMTFRDTGPPDFDGLPVHSYVAEDFQLAIVSCVGCYWGRCVFCSYGNRSLPKGAYQQGTPAQIADSVESVVRRHGVDFVAVVDENTNLRLIVQAMREVRRRGIRVTFSTRNRLESVLLDEEFCRELSALGCVLMSVGYETNAQRLLDLMDKGVVSADYQRIIDNITGAGINLRFSVMGGLFDETDDEAKASREFLRANETKIGIDVLQLMVAEPGTLLAADAARYGITLDRTGALDANPELNYLGGRHGYPLTAPDGPGRATSLHRLTDTFRAVRPQGNDALPPHQRHSRTHGPVRHARLRPWVRPVPSAAAEGTGAGSLLLSDLVWQQIFALPREHVAVEEDAYTLTARSDRGARLLGRLVAADAAESIPLPDRLDAGRVRRVSAGPAPPDTAPRRVVASPEYAQYASDAPPCDAPPATAGRCPQHQTPRGLH
ncbi:radical SAM protein [Streptomyces sp. ET3-23]|uniref:B12-binding domain-containing radical SAM protein n=1 Tax=Streptomyces sp. ET3-23 TaxID=2885643 RepID=UPI001D11618B|nr:radical SAM protein [Streptomyces sp. ET3-23]MCC2279048.1 radical SAM protein [Streptomyces sp. ET3-23]